MICGRSIGLKGMALTFALVGALGLVGAGGNLAHAAIPNNQGCLGEDFSTYAHDGSNRFGPGAEFGQFNASLAQDVPGLGLPIQYHLAGWTPDFVVANSCNNP